MCQLRYRTATQPVQVWLFAPGFLVGIQPRFVALRTRAGQPRPLNKAVETVAATAVDNTAAEAAVVVDPDAAS